MKTGHLDAILSIAENILKKRPVVPTQQLVRAYKETKGQNDTTTLCLAIFSNGCKIVKYNASVVE